MNTSPDRLPFGMQMPQGVALPRSAEENAITGAAEVAAYYEALLLGQAAGFALMTEHNRREAGAEIRRLRKQAEAETEEAKIDPLTGELTRAGLLHELTHNQELIDELRHPYRPIAEGDDIVERRRERRWGIILADIRGVGMANRGGTEHGDHLIKEGFNQLRPLLRSRSNRIDGNADRRARVAAGEDIIVRWGGDEILIIVRNITQWELQGFEGLTDRLASAFALNKATEKDEKGQTPIIMSIGSMMPDFLDNGEFQHIVDGDLFEGIEAMIADADSPQRDNKKAQYRTMWERYLPTLPDEIRASLTMPDKDTVMELYMQTFCPKYWASRDGRRSAKN